MLIRNPAEFTGQLPKEQAAVVEGPEVAMPVAQGSGHDCYHITHDIHVSGFWVGEQKCGVYPERSADALSGEPLLRRSLTDEYSRLPEYVTRKAIEDPGIARRNCVLTKDQRNSRTHQDD